MSRLDSAIRRLEAQRLCLDHAVQSIAGTDGPIFELGLGNGRTYDHLRSMAPNREIFVFDRHVAAHPDCVPDEDHLFLGELSDTLHRALPKFQGSVALIHSDIGSGVESADRELAAWLAPRLPSFLTPHGLLLSDQELPDAGLAASALPAGVGSDRYFCYTNR